MGWTKLNEGTNNILSVAEGPSLAINRRQDFQFAVPRLTNGVPFRTLAESAPGSRRRPLGYPGRLDSRRRHWSGSDGGHAGGRAGGGGGRDVDRGDGRPG